MRLQANKYLTLSIVLSLFTICFLACKGDASNPQVSSTLVSDEKVYKNVDVSPMFPGCEHHKPSDQHKCSNNLIKTYIHRKLVYPPEAKKEGVGGIVLVKFVVNKSGRVQDVEIKSSPDERLQYSVLHMMNRMMHEVVWVPGVKDGKNVNVEYLLPVTFATVGSR